MFQINNKIVTLIRGDSFKSPIIINAGTFLEPIHYTLTKDDTLYFALMEPNQSFENAILKKVYTVDSEKDENGDTYLTFSSNDTENLLPGIYYYTIKLVTTVDNKTEANTIVPNTQFNIIN